MKIFWIWALKNKQKKYFKKYKSDFKSDYIENELIKFIKYAYSYSKITLDKYSSDYSKHTYTQHALFTIIALKIYLNMTYREISDFISFNGKLKRYLCIKNAPNYSTLQKFYKRMPTDMFERITNQIINNLNIKPKTAALDGSGFSNDNADKYYSKIRDKELKNFTKCHITRRRYTANSLLTSTKMTKTRHKIRNSTNKKF